MTPAKGKQREKITSECWESWKILLLIKKETTELKLKTAKRIV